MNEEEFTITNRHGKRIVGKLRATTHTPKGTFILLHGLGGWKDQYLLTVIAESVRALGYQAVTFDAADGAKGPDANFANATTSSYVEDLEDVFKYLRTQKWFAKPVLLAGHSQGGLVALRYARIHSESISKLILIAPLLSWKIGLPWTVPFGLSWLVTNKHFTPGPGPAHTKLLLRRGWLLDFMTYDVSRDGRSVKIPTLVISAQRDDVVGTPKQQSRIIHSLHKVKQVIVKEAGHLFWKHEQKVADTITTWLTSS